MRRSPVGVDDSRATRHTIRFMYVQPPVRPSRSELDALGKVLTVANVVDEAWFAGRLHRTVGAEDRTSSMIVLVVDEPRSVTVRPELTRLVHELSVVATDLGLEIESWAFVPPLVVERELESCAVRIYASE